MTQAQHILQLVIGIFIALTLIGAEATGAELADLRAVRSLVAEAALVSRLVDHHQLTASYAIQAQKIIRAQLQSELRSMDSVGDGANQIRAALAAMQTHNQRGLDRSEQELTQEVKAREKAR